VSDSGQSSGSATFIARLVLIGVVAWWTVRLAAGATQWCFLDLVNLAFHEAGHVFLRPFGSTLHYLGGTLFQLAVPILLAIYFAVKRADLFATAFCGWWLGESLVNVSVYMADARELSLPLVGGGDHDWNELFYRFGVLDEGSVAAISSTTRTMGVVVMVAGLVWLTFFVLPAWLREAMATRLKRR
jgi:hypothetical protein